jgi:hypothetical protein
MTDMKIKDTKNGRGTAALNRIIGARLTSVNFVLDYLILGFDEKGALTSLVWPEISTRGSVLKFGMQYYRDHLCNLITQVVSEAHVSEDDIVTIWFGDDHLRIPLQERQLPGERAIFTAPKHFLYVW